MGIFVSYSSQDRDQAERLIQQLGTLEQDVYFEAKSLQGKVWWSQVFDTIKHADLFVFALTPHTVNSYARIMECSYALALHKRVLWVMIKNIVRLPPELAATQIVDYREDSDAAAQAFAEALTQLPPPEPLPTPLPMPPNWLSPLNELRQRLELPDLAYREQRWIFNNLQEFLERRETFDTAVNLLKLQLARPGIDPRITDEIVGVLSKVDPEFMGRRRQPIPVKRIAVLVGGGALVAALLTNVLPVNMPGMTTSATETSQPTGVAGVVSTDQSGQETLSAQVGGVSGSNVVPAATTVSATVTTMIAVKTAAATASATTPTTNTPAGHSPMLATATPPATSRPTATLVYTYVGMVIADTNNRKGVRVTQIGTAAKQAGVQVGDVILDVDAQQVSSREEFLAAMGQRRSFSVVVLRLQRAGDVILVRLTPAATDYVAQS